MWFFLCIFVEYFYGYEEGKLAIYSEFAAGDMWACGRECALSVFEFRGRRQPNDDIRCAGEQLLWLQCDGDDIHGGGDRCAAGDN